MKIFRVEHIVTGEGPHRSLWKYDDEFYGLFHLYYGNDFPNAFEDIGRYAEEDEYFGCTTIEQLMEWFEWAAEKLVKYGYEIACYDCADEFVVVGKRQVLFVMSEATKIF